MIRNLDLTALRSLVAVADTGGVTRAAHQLNLTQSAVSMQLRRLEESLGQGLIDRSGRTVALTAQGEQLLSYARRLLALNDEALARLTGRDFEGEVSLGVPTDIVYPHVPAILSRFDREYPRVKLTLISSYTIQLKEMLASGEVDLILTTENGVDSGGETLSTQRLVWVGAPGGNAWRQRPLRLAFERACLFRPIALKALDEAGIPWENAVDTGSTRTVEAAVSADLAVHCVVESAVGPQFATVEGLPGLPTTRVNLYARQGGRGAVLAALADVVREAYGRRAEVAA
ncbi:MAG: LysR substrate-binding domain-containing protein [Paracoccaceae bacterium]